ncbi:N-acetyltransferase ESCO2-like, partial [Antrostomus carolinensis]|uniref:N-acetyltransferase ESCO2-like n=1 Tax=Antrostomus carolinensis TaxID=279965 RepID=UPI0010A98BA5
FETPVKKMMMGFTEALPVLQKSRNNHFAPQIKWSSSSSDEMREDEAVPVKPVLSRRLDISPLHAASVPTATQTESSRRSSPKPAAPYTPLVPVVSFYSKEKRYLTPLERKELNQNHPLGERNRGDHHPTTSRTEKTNSSLSRNTSSKPTKHTTNSKHPQNHPQSKKNTPKIMKKAKGEIPAGKPNVEKENVSYLIKKKMDSPFRVLSMTVKPALKLQLGAAFFSARKKSHSKKPLVDTKSLQILPKSLQENHQPQPLTSAKSDSTKRNKTPEAGGVLGRVSAPQKEKEEDGGERENLTSCVNQERDSTCGGETSPQRSGSTSDPSHTSNSAAAGDADVENMEVDEISSTSCESDDCVVLSSQSPPQVHKQ